MLKELDYIFESVNQQSFDYEDFTFDSWFKVGKTGRIFGNFQNIRRVIKQVIYNDCYNYDLSNSQVKIFIELAKEYGISVPVFEKYAEDPKTKNEIAYDLGISTGTWKKMVFSLIFGGTLSSAYAIKNNETKKWTRPTLRKAFDDEMEAKGVGRLMYIDNAQYKEIYKVFCESVVEQLQPFQKEIDEVVRYLSKNYAKHYKSYEQLDDKGVRYIQNACELPFYLDEKSFTKKGDLALKRTRVLLAHLIQGIEAFFIFEITNQVSDHCCVVSNEFDGLITRQPILDGDIEFVKEKTGLEYMELKPKPIYENMQLFLNQFEEDHK